MSDHLKLLQDVKTKWVDNGSLGSFEKHLIGEMNTLRIGRPLREAVAAENVRLTEEVSSLRAALALERTELAARIAAAIRTRPTAAPTSEETPA
jgi:hypothetical protein